MQRYSVMWFFKNKILRISNIDYFHTIDADDPFFIKKVYECNIKVFLSCVKTNSSSMGFFSKSKNI